MDLFLSDFVAEFVTPIIASNHPSFDQLLAGGCRFHVKSGAKVVEAFLEGSFSKARLRLAHRNKETSEVGRQESSCF